MIPNYSRLLSSAQVVNFSGTSDPINFSESELRYPEDDHRLPYGDSRVSNRCPHCDRHLVTNGSRSTNGLQNIGRTLKCVNVQCKSHLGNKPYSIVENFSDSPKKDSHSMHGKPKSPEECDYRIGELKKNLSRPGISEKDAEDIENDITYLKDHKSNPTNFSCDGSDVSATNDCFQSGVAYAKDHPNLTDEELDKVIQEKGADNKNFKFGYHSHNTPTQTNMSTAKDLHKQRMDDTTKAKQKAHEAGIQHASDKFYKDIAEVGDEKHKKISELYHSCKSPDHFTEELRKHDLVGYHNKSVRAYDTSKSTGEFAKLIHESQQTNMSNSIDRNKITPKLDDAELRGSELADINTNHATNYKSRLAHEHARDNHERASKLLSWKIGRDSLIEHHDSHVKLHEKAIADINELHKTNPSYHAGREYVIKGVNGVEHDHLEKPENKPHDRSAFLDGVSDARKSKQTNMSKFNIPDDHYLIIDKNMKTGGLPAQPINGHPTKEHAIRNATNNGFIGNQYEILTHKELKDRQQTNMSILNPKEWENITKNDATAKRDIYKHPVIKSHTIMVERGTGEVRTRTHDDKWMDHDSLEDAQTHVASKSKQTNMSMDHADKQTAAAEELSKKAHASGKSEDHKAAHEAHENAGQLYLKHWNKQLHAQRAAEHKKLSEPKNFSKSDRVLATSGRFRNQEGIIVSFTQHNEAVVEFSYQKKCIYNLSDLSLVDKAQMTTHVPDGGILNNYLRGVSGIKK